MDYEGFVHIFNLFVCSNRKKNRTVSDLMLNISLSVCQSLVDKSFVLWAHI